MGKVKGKVIAIYNQKGGVGKTTTTVAFAGILSLLEKNVLVVDTEAQSNCSSTFRVGGKEEEGGLYKMICENASAEDTIVCSDVALVDVIPSGYKRRKASDYLTRRSDPDVVQYEVVGALKRKLLTIADNYDFILIDCSPSEDIISDCVLCAATDVIVPVGTDTYSYDGVRLILDSIMNARRRFNPKLNLVGILMTCVSKRESGYKYFSESYLKQLKGNAIRQPIRKDAEVKNRGSNYRPLFSTRRRSPGKGDYIKAACEIGLIGIKDAEKLLKRFAMKDEMEFEYWNGESNG